MWSKRIVGLSSRIVFRLPWAAWWRGMSFTDFCSGDRVRPWKREERGSERSIQEAWETSSRVEEEKLPFFSLQTSLCFYGVKYFGRSDQRNSSFNHCVIHSILRSYMPNTQVEFPTVASHFISLFTSFVANKQAVMRKWCVDRALTNSIFEMKGEFWNKKPLRGQKYPKPLAWIIIAFMLPSISSWLGHLFFLQTHEEDRDRSETKQAPTASFHA